METNENKKADDFIKELKSSFYFRTLTPQREKEGIYHVDIKFTSYIKLIYTVQDLLKIALHTLENSDLENSSQIEIPLFILRVFWKLQYSYCRAVKRKGLINCTSFI